MIGLPRNIVRLVEHDPAWTRLFETEAQTIRETGGALVLDIQHIGSTSVPGLVAKPILDIGVAVRVAGDIPELASRLIRAGYIDRGDQGSEGGYYLVRESAPGVRTVHLHIVEHADPQWSGWLVFRGALRRDAGLRERYELLKRKLAAAYPADRLMYTDGKNEFIRSVIEADRSEPDRKDESDMAGDQDYPYDTRLDVKFPALAVVDVPALVRSCTHPWYNQTLCRVNDSVVRLGVLKGEYHWHKHDADDEFFFVLEGSLIVDLEDRSVILGVQEGFVVPKGVVHRTRAPERVVILMVETAAIVPTGTKVAHSDSVSPGRHSKCFSPGHASRKSPRGPRAT